MRITRSKESRKDNGRVVDFSTWKSFFTLINPKSLTTAIEHTYSWTESKPALFPKTRQHAGNAKLNTLFNYKALFLKQLLFIAYSNEDKALRTLRRLSPRGSSDRCCSHTVRLYPFLSKKYTLRLIINYRANLTPLHSKTSTLCHSKMTSLKISRVLSSSKTMTSQITTNSASK